MSGKAKGLSAERPSKGFYVYCIRLRAADAKIIQAKPILFKDIEAIVSEVDLSKFNEEIVKSKLLEDIKWTEEHIRRHHNIIAAAYEMGAVIPLKFGTIFKTKKGLEAMLKKYYKKFKRLLAGLNNKQEWGVKMYLEREKFVESLKKRNEEIKRLEGKKVILPKGMQWYVDKKIEELIGEKLEKEIEKQLQRIVKGLEDCCEQIALCDLLPNDNVLNAACLIDKDKLDYFKKMLQEAREECEPIGATLITAGPWPPYNFVQLKDEKK